MIINSLTKKIGILLSAVIVTLLIYTFPQDKSDDQKEKVNNYPFDSIIYLKDEHNYIARVNINNYNDDIIKQAYNILAMLTINNEIELPLSFKALIPMNTKVLSIDYNNELLKVNFSKELLNVKENDEEQMLESIVYSLTEIKNVSKIMIFVEDELLTTLPHSKKYLPQVLDRSIGINKTYDISSLRNNTAITVYYLTKNNNLTYYTPVTKIISGNKEKIEIIIEELQSSTTLQTNLKSYLSMNTKLENYEFLENAISLSFNNDLLDHQNNIIEEITYTIALSIKDSYDINNVIYKVNDDFIKTVSLENT